MTREPSEAGKRMMGYAMLAETARQLDAGGRDPDDHRTTGYSLRGWARGLRADDYRTAADLMERAADELDRHSVFLRRITAAYGRQVKDQTTVAMLEWAADLEDAVAAALEEFAGDE